MAQKLFEARSRPSALSPFVFMTDPQRVLDPVAAARVVEGLVELLLGLLVVLGPALHLGVAGGGTEREAHQAAADLQEVVEH